MSRFTRGFSGRKHADRDERLPPGQYDAGKTWPVLTAEVTPKLPTDSWHFTVDGLVERPTTWTRSTLSRRPPTKAPSTA
jgi:DMSO/TMAO reductase YedYZ molybdopterin-dependent catalytic subunit